MVEAVRWKIFYDNGQSYSNEDGLAEDAPIEGIVAVVEKLANRTVRIYEGRDFYFWNGENWVAGYQADLERWLRRILPALKYGIWTKDGIFKDVMEEANRWP